MGIIQARVSEQEVTLIQQYAETNNVSVSTLIRESILDKIEDEIDLNLYERAMEEHNTDPQDISFDEMMSELSDK